MKLILLNCGDTEKARSYCALHDHEIIGVVDDPADVLRVIRTSGAGGLAVDDVADLLGHTLSLVSKMNAEGIALVSAACDMNGVSATSNLAYNMMASTFRYLLESGVLRDICRAYVAAGTGRPFEVTQLKRMVR